MKVQLIAVCAVLVGAQISVPTAQTTQGRGARDGRVAGAGTFENAVTGRVTTSDGQPIAGALVTLLRPRVAFGKKELVPVDVRIGVNTGADGRYRISDLSPGDYAVVVFPRNRPLADDNKPNTVGWRVTYFPAATDRANAELVHVDFHKAAVADVHMPSARLAMVSGRALDSRSKPVHGGTLQIAHGDGLSVFDGRTSKIRPDGEFDVTGLEPGTYFMLYSPPRSNRWKPGDAWEVSRAQVVVAERDLTGVEVLPLTMVRASGRVILDGGPNKSPTPRTIRVSAFPFVSDGNPGPQEGGVANADLTFSFRTWPSVGRIRVRIDGVEVYPTSVLLNGRDVTATGVMFTQGKDITGLVVHVR